MVFLKPGEDRPCLTVDMWIDAGGHKLRHRFGRAMMRSAARMTYDRVQALHDGKRDTDSPDLPEGLLNALYGAYRALLKKRKEQGAIDLDMPEDAYPSAKTERSKASRRAFGTIATG